MTATERSVVILKPDAIERRLVGELMQRLEGLGLDLREAYMTSATDSQLAAHYPDSLAPTIGEKSRNAGTDVGDDPAAYGREVLGWNRRYMQRARVLVMVWEGPNAIRAIRTALGHTDPSAATPGTIRGDLGVDSIAVANKEKRGTENLVHASGSQEEANDEIAIWFPSLVPS